MKGKAKSLLVCVVSLLAIIGILCIMSSNIAESIDKKTSISN